VDPYPQVKVVDFIRLMQDFLAKRTDVHQYCRSYFDLSKMRIDVSDDEDKILQEAYGDADDFDDVVHLEYTIDETQLRERVWVHWRDSRHWGAQFPTLVDVIIASLIDESLAQSPRPAYLGPHDYRSRPVTPETVFQCPL
jgi:hypothetical protein